MQGMCKQALNRHDCQVHVSECYSKAATQQQTHFSQVLVPSCLWVETPAIQMASQKMVLWWQRKAIGGCCTCPALHRKVDCEIHISGHCNMPHFQWRSLLQQIRHQSYKISNALAFATHLLSKAMCTQLLREPSAAALACVACRASGRPRNTVSLPLDGCNGKEANQGMGEAQAQQLHVHS